MTQGLAPGRAPGPSRPVIGCKVPGVAPAAGASMGPVATRVKTAAGLPGRARRIGGGIFDRSPGRACPLGQVPGTPARGAIPFAPRRHPPRDRPAGISPILARKSQSKKPRLTLEMKDER